VLKTKKTKATEKQWVHCLPDQKKKNTTSTKTEEKQYIFCRIEISKIAQNKTI
jgi:hypothetical protein